MLTNQYQRGSSCEGKVVVFHKSILARLSSRFFSLKKTRLNTFRNYSAVLLKAAPSLVLRGKKLLIEGGQLTHKPSLSRFSHIDNTPMPFSQINTGAVLGVSLVAYPLQTRAQLGSCLPCYVPSKTGNHVTIMGIKKYIQSYTTRPQTKPSKPFSPI